MMFEIEAVDQAIEPVDTNDFMEATNESEELNNFGMNIDDEDDLDDERILGKVFDIPDDAYTFYNDHSFLHDFGIRSDDTIKNPKTNEPFRKIYVCNKEGFNRMDKNASSDYEKKLRRDVRTGCQAKLQITRHKDGKWLVDSFNDTHNHELTMTPMKVTKHRSHSNFHRSIEGKSLMVQFGQIGLKHSHIKKDVNTMKTSNVADVTSKQCADDLSEHRKQHKGKESRDAYTKFIDVVVFNVTYITNEFKMPLVPFTGVSKYNYYRSRQSYGRCNKKVFPKTRHRFCSWHIRKHETEHIRLYVSLYNDFQETHKKWVNSDTIEHFKATLDDMCIKYELENSCWISDMYNQLSVKCSCAMYETNGILCKHNLNAMKKKHVQELPNHYILSRWTLDARYKLGSVSIGLEEMNNENAVSNYTLWCVHSNFSKLIEQARDSPSDIQKMIKQIEKNMSLENASHSSCIGVSHLSIRDPLGPTTTKGRPKIASRIKSSLEAQQTCSYCQGLGHYATSCLKRKVDESLQET
uniref:SWIM-type domain-containing protein n=1 Tax=Lactuca sativa TaxID=4236 RepID=A0A9R1V251_LACSA|nr:hypothetical protein LSAT_V11C700361200 [Lactuca sativa]